MLSGTPRLEASSLLAGRGTFVRLSVVVLAAVSLAACAQSKVATRKYEPHPVRQASLDQDRSTSSMMKRRVAAVRKHIVASRSDAGGKTASHGVASYYSEGTKTASG